LNREEHEGHGGKLQTERRDLPATGDSVFTLFKNFTVNSFAVLELHQGKRSWPGTRLRNILQGVLEFLREGALLRAP